jgi:hypothetical protein
LYVAGRQLHHPHSTVHDVNTRLRLLQYKFQLKQRMKAANRDCRKRLSEEMLQKIYSDEIFSGTCVFFDKANSILMVS